MTYKALYRTYRPVTFDEIVGQDHIVQTLSNALTNNKLAHAYLFTGPRGTGKTSVAKLLAKAVNCTDENVLICNKCQNCQAALLNTHPDVVEIDAASNNGVDEIRDLIDKVKYSPLMGKYKIYIIDEVHMLSTGAFNALLKTLEEPPAHIIFILATTEPHKVLATIISRCQRYDFVKVTEEHIEGVLKKVLESEKIAYEGEALQLISALAEGGMRDALSILDQSISYSEGKLTALEIREVYGITTYEDKLNFIQLIVKQDVPLLLKLINDFDSKGVDLRRLTLDLVKILKDLTVYLQTSEISLTSLVDNAFLKQLLPLLNPEQIFHFINVLMQTYQEYRFSGNIKTQFELAILSLTLFNSQKEITNSVTQVAVKEDLVVKTPEVIIEDKVVPTLKVTAKPEVIKEEVAPTTKADPNKLMPQSFDQNYYLSLLVGAQRPLREKLVLKWPTLKDYTLDLNYSRMAKALLNSKLIAAGENYLIVTSEFEALAEEINMLIAPEDLINFTTTVFNHPYRVFALNLKQHQELITAFKKHQSENSLPQMVTVEFETPKTTIETPTTTEEKIIDLFGSNMFEIIE